MATQKAPQISEILLFYLNNPIAEDNNALRLYELIKGLLNPEPTGPYNPFKWATDAVVWLLQQGDSALAQLKEVLYEGALIANQGDSFVTTELVQACIDSVYGYKNQACQGHCPLQFKAQRLPDRLACIECDQLHLIDTLGTLLDGERLDQLEADLALAIVGGPRKYLYLKTNNQIGFIEGRNPFNIVWTGHAIALSFREFVSEVIALSLQIFLEDPMNKPKKPPDKIRDLGLLRRCKVCLKFFIGQTRRRNYCSTECKGEYERDYSRRYMAKRRQS